MRRALAASVVSIVATAAVWANWSDTSTGIDLTRLPAFPLTKIRSGLLKDHQQIRFDGLTARMEGPIGGPVVDETVLQGKAKSGKTWSVHFAWAAFDQIYRGDLDGSGTQDYVVIGGTPFYNGRLAPSGTISILLMDHQGLPVPFETFLYDDLGPRHVVDVLHDGHARLAIGDYDEDAWDNRAGGRCSGHWVTSLYEPKDFNWGEFRGSAGDRTFPFVHEWTYGPDCIPADPSQPPWHPNVVTGGASTDSAGITSVQVAEAGQNQVVKLTPASGCETVSIETAVYEQPSRREIAFLSRSDFEDGLLKRVVADRAVATLRGVSRNPNGKSCTANQLWAAK